MNVIITAHSYGIQEQLNKQTWQILNSLCRWSSA